MFALGPRPAGMAGSGGLGVYQRFFRCGLISRRAVHQYQDCGNSRTWADVVAAVRHLKSVMVLPLLVTTAFGLVAWTAPRPACALADAQGVAAEDLHGVVPLDEVPPPGGPVHLDQASLPGATLPDADRLVATSKAYGAEHPEVFAGLLLAEGRLWLGFTTDAGRHLAAVRARVDHPDLLRAFVADFAERELRGLQERIALDLARLAEEGVEVTTVGVDVRRNRVEVGLRSVGNGAPEALARNYGTAMLLVREGVDLRTIPAPVLRQRDQVGDDAIAGRSADVERGGCSSSASVPKLRRGPHVQ